MATDTDRLIISLEASVTKFERELRKARGTADTQTRAIENRFNSMNQAISQGQRRLGSGIAGVLGTREIIQYADAFTKAQNSLRVAGLEGRNLESTFGKVVDVANRTGAPIGTVADLFGKLTMNQKELGATSADMLGVTEAVGNAIKVAGVSSEQASGAVLGLTQAFGTTRVQTEDFNQVMEGLRPLAQAAANGLEEAGGSVSKFRELVKDGKISGEVFFRAIQAGSAGLADQAGSSVLTFAQSWTKVENAITLAVGALEKMLNTSGALSSWTDAIVSDIAKIPASFQSTIDEVNRLIAIFNMLKQSAQDAMTVGPTPDRPLTFSVKPKQAELYPDRDPYGMNQPLPKSKYPTVSIKDFKPASGDKKKGGGADTNYYQDEIDKIKERTGAIQAETAAVGQGEAATAKAKATYDLLTAAKDQGITVGDKEKAQIDEIATAYGDAVKKLKDAEKATRDAQRAMAEWNDLAKDAIGGIASDLLDGVNAAQSLENALKRVADRLLSMALDTAFAGSGGKGGLIGDLFKGIAGARASGGPVQSGKTYLVGENGPEMVRFGRNGTVVPNTAIKQGGGGGGETVVNVIHTAGTTSEQRETKTAGGTRIDVMVKEMAAQSALPGQPLNRVLRQMPAGKPGLTRR